MANEIYDSTWWGNTIDTASSIGTSTEMIQGQFNMLTSNQPNLVTNGDFSDGDTGWVKGTAPSATQEVVNGSLVMYAGSASDSNNALSRTDTLQGYNNKMYKLELSRSNFVNGSIGYLRLDGAYDSSNIISFSEGTSIIYFTAYRDFTHIRFFAGSAEAGYTIDNVSVKQIRATTVEASKCLADAIHRIGIQNIQN